MCLVAAFETHIAAIDLGGLIVAWSSEAGALYFAIAARRRRTDAKRYQRILINLALCISVPAFVLFGLFDVAACMSCAEFVP